MAYLSVEIQKFFYIYLHAVPKFIIFTTINFFNMQMITKVAV